MPTNTEVSCWDTVCTHFGGKIQIRALHLGTGANRKRMLLPSMRLEIGEAVVHGELEAGGDPPYTFSRLRSSFRGADNLKLRVYRNFLYPQLGRATGVEDLVVGDPHFDRNFLVRSNDPQYAKVWLDRAVRSHILNAPDYCFEIDRGEILASSHLTTDDQQLRSAALALAALVASGERFSERVYSLANRLGSSVTHPGTHTWNDAEGMTFSFPCGGRQIELRIAREPMAKRGRAKLLTRLSCRRLALQSDRFVLYADHLHRKDKPDLARRLARKDMGLGHPPGYILHAGHLERVQDKLRARWGERLMKLQPLVFSCSEALVEILWEGAEVRESVLRDAAELIEHIAVDRAASRALGPYR